MWTLRSVLRESTATCGVPVKYSAPPLLDPLEYHAFKFESKFSAAAPLVSTDIAALLSLLVRSTHISDAFDMNDRKSAPMLPSFRALLVPIWKRSRRQFALSSIEALVWSMFKRRLLGQISVKQANGRIRHLLYVWNQDPALAEGHETARSGELIGQWLDVSYDPASPPQSHQLDVVSDCKRQRYKSLIASLKGGRGIPLVCAACGEPDSVAKKWKHCAPCKHVDYCSEHCQKADWRRHKNTEHPAKDSSGSTHNK
jgi:hypothetical protein